MFGRKLAEGAVFGRASGTYGESYDLTQGGPVTRRMYNAGVRGNPSFRDLFRRAHGKPDRNKYKLESHPLEEEDRKRTMQAPDSLKAKKASANRLWKELSAEVNRPGPRHYDEPGSQHSARRAAEIRDEGAFLEAGKIAAKERYKGYKEKVDQDFTNDFVEWLRGRGKRDEYERSGWDPKIWDPEAPNNRHGRPISEHESIRDYLVGHLSRKNEYEHELARMKLMTGAMSGKHMTLDEAWRYYKYVVRNLPHDEHDEDEFEDVSHMDSHAERHYARYENAVAENPGFLPGDGDETESDDDDDSGDEEEAILEDLREARGDVYAPGEEVEPIARDVRDVYAPERAGEEEEGEAEEEPLQINRGGRRQERQEEIREAQEEAAEREAEEEEEEAEADAEVA